VVGIIGDPVAHSRSPAIHNAAFAELGLDWVYVAFPVPRGAGEAAVGAVRVLGLAGLNVTMPHKSAAAVACDELSDAARALDSVNTVVNHNGVLFGDSTDGAGLLAALRDERLNVSGAGVLVLGAGGAARAIVHALGRAGARITVAGGRPHAGAGGARRPPHTHDGDFRERDDAGPTAKRIG
jgi:shikimate dehydrogenase